MAQCNKPWQEKRKGTFMVEDGASVRIILRANNLEIEEPDQTQVWCTDYLVFNFAVNIPKEYSEDEILFNASIYINNIKATNLILVAECRGDKKLTILRKDFNSAFLSYASEDRKRVAIFKQILQISRPDLDIFFDVESLRSGEQWEPRLYREIEDRDILFLCWSLAARQSKYVEAEWHYALKQKGIDCIEPIPIDAPDKCPPPPELQALHFNDKLLYIINENGKEET